MSRDQATPHFRFYLNASARKEKRRFHINLPCSSTTYPNNLSHVIGMVVRLPWKYVLLVCIKLHY